MMNDQKGQSLIEIVVGLAVGALLIGAAVVGIVFVLRSGSINQSSETAAALARDLLLRVRATADSNWLAMHNLPKGPDFLYYVSASGTELAILEGLEGVAVDAPSEGLRARWGLDESSGDMIHDSFPNGIQGRAFGTTYSSSCRIGGCRVFNGSGDFVFFGNNPTLDFPGSFTLSLWMRANAIPERSDNAGLISKDGLRYGLTYRTDDNAWFYVGDATNYAHAPVSPGSWHHVVGVFDADTSPKTLTLYVDGAPASTSTSAFASSGAGGDFIIGHYNSNYFSGRIDDVRVFDRALSAAEVYALYGSPTFTRYATLQGVLRSPAGEIVFSGGAEDPSTLEANVRVSWIASDSSQSHFDLKDYLTRWRNEVTHQTDWSGGAEPLTPISEPGGGYSNSSNIRFLPGEIRLNEL